MNQRGEVALPVIIGGAVVGLAGGAVALVQAEANPTLTLALTNLASIVTALVGQHLYHLKRHGKPPSAWDGAKLMAELTKALESRDKHLQEAISKDVEDAIHVGVAALKELAREKEITELREELRVLKQRGRP